MARDDDDFDGGHLLRTASDRADEAIGKPITIVIPPELQDQEPLILARIAKGERIDWFETEG